jgi:hypothetical protein
MARLLDDGPHEVVGSLFEAAMLHVVFIGFQMPCLSTQATND